ncbi:Retrovirus-related Pol polyprotein from transposon TNT 1-94 [Vitis vinifera]|uniref:Retrovirus-related Pol polyprotein from transposon TNT 1-94 n=1 Tax=Vitis vinifera TaxID=29760 RepID=A0A438K4J2_VITVI|nr:Retrovirus-related Pol polyprotein from transposon TNT 1-94 [Vitis vinifera]
MKDLEDIAVYRKSIERQRVHIFLAGLDVRHANMKAESDNPDTSAMTGHTKSRCFEIVGYPDWWDHNCDQRNKDSKKTSIAIVAEIKTEANVAKKASTLVVAIDYGDHMTFDSRQVSPLRPSSQKIVSTTNGNTTPVLGEGSLTPHRHNKAIPNSVQEALVDPRWKAAMNEEMKSLQNNETSELVECPLGKKLVGCRWIYTVKYKANGSIERFKARPIANGYTPTYEIDYTQTFAPIAKINTVRVLLSLAANLD